MSKRGAMFPTWLLSYQDFVNLTERQQLLFMKLWLSPNLDSAGFHPLQIGKWARGFTPRATEAEMHQAVLGLEEAGWVAVDYDLEEVFVRPVIRWDAAAKPQIFIAACRAVQAAQSLELRAEAWKQVMIVHPTKCEGLRPEQTRAYEDLARFMQEHGKPFGNRSGTLREGCSASDVESESEPGREGGGDGEVTAAGKGRGGGGCSAANSSGKANGQPQGDHTAAAAGFIDVALPGLENP